MMNRNPFHLNLNKETKRAVVVLSIIALLILIVGIISVVIRLSDINTPPAPPNVSAKLTRTCRDGKYLVLLNADSTDPDGDVLTYEYDGAAEDGYYPLGTHIVKARANDRRGGLSAWTQTNFTITNEAPTRPVITRTPSANVIEPGLPVKVTAVSTDPDSDDITYVWDGRQAETATYDLGKHTIRVRAVDGAGAESPWAAVMFFVMDSEGSGGMMLNGPDSAIHEDGFEGATISSYTFNVPAVVNHKGQDFGRVRGYNVHSGEWEQLDYGETTNGIAFEKSLQSGTYSRLEFYYYTNHDCMYNKSNITYTVDYYFE